MFNIAIVDINFPGRFSSAFTGIFNDVRTFPAALYVNSYTIYLYLFPQIKLNKKKNYKKSYAD